MTSAAVIERRKAKAVKLNNDLKTFVEQYDTEDDWKTYLDIISHFRQYSARNIMLIHGQCPNASRVAGFRKWGELGYRVRKGEHGIKIFGFTRVGGNNKNTDNDDQDKDEENKKSTSYVYFPVLTVFDRSQVDAVDENALNTDPSQHHMLNGDDNAQLLPILVKVGESMGYDITFDHTRLGDAHGRTSFGINGAKRITVSDQLSPAHQVKTMLHELAHAYLHAGTTEKPCELERSIKECEAESVAYCVAGALGIDTSDYSVYYVAHWSNKNKDEVLLGIAHRVKECSFALLDMIEDMSNEK